MSTYKESKFIVDSEGRTRRIKGISRLVHYLGSSKDPTEQLSAFLKYITFSIKLIYLHIITITRKEKFNSTKDELRVIVAN